MRYQESDVHLRYDRGRAVSAEAIEQLLAVIRQQARRPVHVALDLGCGTGRFTDALSRQLAQCVLGIDLAQNMLAVARDKSDRGARAAFARARAEALPLANCSVDLVFLSQVLHHLDDPHAALAQIARVLRTGGTLAIRQTTLENLDGYLYQRFFPEARAVDEARLPARDSVIRLTSAAGLVPTSRQTLSHVVAHTAAQYVSRIELRSYSDLDLVSEDAFARGMAAMRSFLDDGQEREFTEDCDLLTFVRR